jgi:hypothetical protein
MEICLPDSQIWLSRASGQPLVSSPAMFCNQVAFHDHNILCIAVSTVYGHGEYIVTHTPSHVTFRQTDQPISGSELSKVLTSTYGFTANKVHDSVMKRILTSLRSHKHVKIIL